MSGNQCECGQPIQDDGAICSTCTLDLRDLLIALAGYAEDVAGAVARQRGAGAQTFTKHRKWTPEAHPLPVDFEAAAVGLEVWDLATWCGGKVGGPLGMPGTHQSAKALLLLAADERDRLRMDEDAPVVLDSARSVNRAAMALLDAGGRSGRARPYLGQCECGATLHGRHRADEVQCQRCGAVHNVALKREAVRAEAENDWWDVAQAVEWVELMEGEVIPDGTVKSWMHRGQLPRNAEGQIVAASLRRLVQNRRVTRRSA